MKTKTLLKKIAKYFPKSLAESYDHVGLQCGKIKEETNTILLCLDCLLYTSINESALGSLKEIEGVTVIDVPSLLLGIFSALSGITVFFHALTIKK